MSDELPQIIVDLAKRARSASLSLACASTKDKNDALQNIAEGLESNRKLLTEENQKDLDAARELESLEISHPECF